MMGMEEFQSRMAMGWRDIADDHSRDTASLCSYVQNGIIALGAIFIFIIPSNTDRDNRIRIINARELTKAERKAYEEEN